jgi:predicted 2-oxoglutarate/Fe(II)-dependent dioxygenase YbiX
MSLADSSEGQITLGDPVPRFNARLITGDGFDLHVYAGRWVVLAFMGSPDDPRVEEEVATLMRDADLFDDDHLVARVVFTALPSDAAKYAALSSKAFAFIADYDGSITRSFGAHGAPRTIVLDPLLRAIANIPWDHPHGHAASVSGLLHGLPAVDDSAGVPMFAPALIVPRVLDFPLCEFLVDFHEKNEAEDSGFMLDVDGKTRTVLDYRLKRRHDVMIAAPELRDVIRQRIVRRLVPEMERFFQFRATRMDRHLIACYDAGAGGHFYRHRDNINAGAQHRRFAVTINLNKDFDGGDLVFPEFGRRAYRAPCGAAIVFSCGALHQVTPVTRGKRYAFLAFLYNEADAAKREANNARLHADETRYDGAWDRLFPDQPADEKAA